MTRACSHPPSQPATTPFSMPNLLAPPKPALHRAIGRCLAAISRTAPVPQARKRELPFAVQELSRILTSERAELRHSYWTHSRLVSAYLYYFLPWNLYRLGWLIPQLDLGLGKHSRILDLGSGPLTLPLALWCARPDLRDTPMTFVCSDVSERPLSAGLALFRELGAEKDGPWRFTTLRAPLEVALSRAATPENDGYSLIMAGNVLNELSPLKNRTPEERVERSVAVAARLLKPGGRLFLVEPGTRLGSRSLCTARAAALSAGMEILAPCPHKGPCPMFGQRAYYPPSPHFTGWCHFLCPAKDAPAQLASLAAQAKLAKQSLALSCLLAQRPMSSEGTEPGARAGAFPGFDLAELEALYEEAMRDEGESSPPHAAPEAEDSPRFAQAGLPLPQVTEPMVARVISDLIRLPDHREPARYACCPKGLALLTDAVRVPSGAASLVHSLAPGEEGAPTGNTGARSGRKPEEKRGERPGKAGVKAKQTAIAPVGEVRDAKTGALMVALVGRQRPQTGQ